jgi:putative PIN family toxin of toxin-antitoxin system
MSPRRVVLDTNVLLSALLFAQGRLSWLRNSWQVGVIVPVLSAATTRELIRVLAYPKFKLTAREIPSLLEDLLPWCETWDRPIPKTSAVNVRDPEDQPFLNLALAAGVDALVSGDQDLLVLASQLEQPDILSPADFRLGLQHSQGS